MGNLSGRDNGLFSSESPKRLYGVGETFNDYLLAGGAKALM